MTKKPKTNNRPRFYEAPPRFLFVFKRKRDLVRQEEPAKENRWIESMILIACCFVLVAMIVLVIKVLGHKGH